MPAPAVPDVPDPPLYIQPHTDTSFAFALNYLKNVVAPLGRPFNYLLYVATPITLSIPLYTVFALPCDFLKNVVHPLGRPFDYLPHRVLPTTPIITIFFISHCTEIVKTKLKCFITHRN
jgi:hypothetical protein